MLGRMVSPPGVTFHAGRFMVESPALDSDDAFLELLAGIRRTIPNAVRDVMTCLPDHLIMGMSAETFWGGKIGAVEFEADLRVHAGDIGITLGATACAAALERMGVSLGGTENGGPCASARQSVSLGPLLPAAAGAATP